MNDEFTLEYESDEICQVARNGNYISTDEVVDILNNQQKQIKELQERNNRQGETLQKQQDMIDNYIDIKAKLNAKITEYETKAEEYELSACGCGSKHNWIKKTALEEFKEEVYPK